jgi:tryptophan halogenase
VKHIVIVGNGPAAAAAAAAVAISLRGSETTITLLDSPNVMATAPIVVSRGGPNSFHHLLGIDEQALMQRAGGVFGLGTRYRGFQSDDRDVFVPLGSHGMTLRLVDFHHYVAKLRAEGSDEDYNAYSLPAAAAAIGRFTPPGSAEDPVQKTVEYDTCFDRDRYARFMRESAAELGVTVVTAAVEAVDLGGDGMIEAAVLADGNRIGGDLFIDCSDNRALIGHLGAANEFDDWSRWLPCDRIASVQTKTLVSPDLFTSIEAHDNGWVRRTMLSDATATAFVYSSQHAEDEFARQFLGKNVYRAVPDDIRVETRSVGAYDAHWIRNCVAIGPAAGSLEPMEVSPMHVVHRSLMRLLAMLPRRKTSAMLAAEFNRVTSEELRGARDYQILRYALADRRKGPFWESLDGLQVPDSLQSRIDLFRNHGRISGQDHEYFSKARWVSSFINFGFWPSSYDPLADMIDEQRMRTDVSSFREKVQQLGSVY